MIERATFSAREVSKLLGISLSAVYSATRLGLLPSLSVGVRRRVFPKAAILKILQDDTNVNNHSVTDKENAALVGTAQKDRCRHEDSAKTS